MRSTISAGVSRIQEQTKGMSFAQAEEFIQHHSEILIKDAGDFFREAVKIVPPEGDPQSTNHTVWAGPDSWMFSDMSEADSAGSSKGKQSTKALIATRTDSLLLRLRTEENIILMDPSRDSNLITKDTFDRWRNENVIPSGGVTSEHWKENRLAALDEQESALLTLQARLGE
jgi:hypothetical protein